MNALRGLFGLWACLAAAVIEFYARRYEYSGVALLPDGAVAILALAILFLPRRRFAWIALRRDVAQPLAVGIVCAAALLFAVRHQFQFVQVLIVSGLLAAALAGLWPLLLLPLPAGSLRFLTALVLATLNFALLLYYAVLIIGKEMWNQVVSRELLWTYARQLPELIAAMPVSPWLPWTASGGLYLALILIYWLAAPGIAREVRSTGARIRIFLAPAGPIHRRRMSAVILVLGSLALSAEWIFRAAAYGDTPDPLVTTFLVEQGRPGTPNMAFMSDPALAALDREVAATYVAPARFTGKTLVLITVDALRADQMNVYGHARHNTPFLSRMYSDGKLARFDNAFSACTESLCGLLAIHAGRYWHQLGTRNFGLADVLKRLGYRNEFLLSGDHSSFYGLRSSYGVNVDEYVDGSSSPGYMNDDSDVLGWLARLDPAGATPRFIYIHLMSVHLIGKRLPQYRVWYKTAAGASGIENCCSTTVDYANKYHDGILQADAMIEKIFALLRSKRLLEDAVVAITADHGEMLGEQGRLSHGGPPLDPAVR
ncbi:MAG: sulfatase-like hydrolase/transferase, partial [Burkholderiales bacterium]